MKERPKGLDPYFDAWNGAKGSPPSLLIRTCFRFFGCAIRLHCFRHADKEGCFHTHPAYAIRIILKGGYVEELGDGTFKTWKPGMIGIIRPEFEHRVASVRNGKESWSLWLRGPTFKEIKARGCD